MSLTNPGAVTSALRTAPPTSSLASRTTTSHPASTRAFAATSPFGPAPITTASAVCPAMSTPRDRHLLTWSLPTALAHNGRSSPAAARRPGGARRAPGGPGFLRRHRAVDDGGPMTLADLLPTDPEPDAIYDAFAGWVEGRGIELYPAQQEALIEIVSGANVILSTPTGSGKSLVATGAHFAALARDGVTFYTAPIKALVSEKFFALCDIFGAEDVGMLTGDASVNADAPIICCTAEVLANIALREGRHADVGAGGDGRVPLLLRAGPGLGLAGAAARAAPGPVRPDVGHAGGRRAVPDRPDPSYRPAHRRRHLRRPAGAAVLQLRPHPAAGDARGAAHHPPGARLRRPLHPGRGAGAGPVAAEHHRRHPRGARQDRRGDRRLPVRPRLRQAALPPGPSRHRRPPRRDAAASTAGWSSSSPRPGC